MMIETYILYSVLAAIAVLLLFTCGALLRIEARCRRLEEFKLSVTEKPSKPTAAAADTVQVMLYAKLERSIARLEQALESTSTSAPNEHRPLSQSLPIENAVRMAKQGASIDELTRSCGLSIGEARLMQRLHGRAQMAAVGG
jgi:hypothetical protein